MRSPGSNRSASGHFQHHPDPATQAPSADAAYANPSNEVWLDFTTDAAGAGAAAVDAPWGLTEQHRPYALVLHAEATATEAGRAGQAGARIACLTLDYPTAPTISQQTPDVAG